jgi:microcompartment protein CcmL/EutN
MTPVAIAAVETSSIAQGTVAGDAMVKTAEVSLLEARPLSPGKYWVLIGGQVAEVRAAWNKGLDAAADTLLDSLFIPQLHPMVLPALEAEAPAVDEDALGVIETLTAASAILASDRAAKTAQVTLRRIRLANGLGGKGFVFLSGDVSNVQAAVDAGRAEALQRGLLVRSVVVPRLHPQMKERVFG